ncbi:hypothetical protein DL240_08750 [Lujinxingia litoralis]|uniref:Uncharacterized protein n=1 Tax=Lujinxingia litoralis TaxID=2211119 RepID=A0A328C8H8_9DELT|nr:tetratricopeptide repeat protein [Lujinxingia litoralis]RAL22970.1 hypothetical protein DL240_08750 [Lujinxingia litoralis]
MSEQERGKYEEEKGLLYKMAERVTAGESLASILEIESAEMAYFEGCAYEFHRQGEFERAEEVALGVLALDERRAYALLVMGDVALKRRDSEQAVMWLERAAGLAPDDIGVLIRLGEALMRTGRFERARKVLDQVISDGGGRDDIYLRRAYALKRVIRDRQHEEEVMANALPSG